MVRGHLVLCKTHELCQAFAAHADEMTLISLPLKIREGDGWPVRAVALVD